MITTYETSFRVMPTQCNPLSPMIFGGAFFSEIDLCAATCVKRLLYSSKTCKEAVTHKVLDLTFNMPMYLGDLVHLRAKIVELRHKAITVEVKMFRELPESVIGNEPKLEAVGKAKFVFISIINGDNVGDKPKKLPYADHGLSLPQTEGWVSNAWNVIPTPKEFVEFELDKARREKRSVLRSTLGWVEFESATWDFVKELAEKNLDWFSPIKSKVNQVSHWCDFEETTVNLAERWYEQDVTGFRMSKDLVERIHEAS